MIRQKFMDAYHDKTPVIVNKVLPNNDCFYFNVYSFINLLDVPIHFNINDADATKLIDIQDNGITESIVGKVRYISPEKYQSYRKGAAEKTERMREGLLSDGTKTLKISIWADMIDLIKEDHLIQFFGIVSRIYHDEIVLSTNASTAICFLTETLDVEFDESVVPKKDDEQHNFIMCCPMVESVKIDTFLSCKSCRKKVIVKPGTGYCMCLSCSREFSIQFLSKVDGCSQKTVTLDISNDAHAATVTVFKEVLEEFFSKDDVSDDNVLKGLLFNISKVDFEIGKGQKVKSLTKHND